MPLDKIRDLLRMEASGKPCQETADFFTEQRMTIKARIQALQDFDFTLSLYVDRCQSGCMQDNLPCQIYDELAR